MKKIFLPVFNVLLMIGYSWGAIIDPARITTWDPGIPGGIPSRTTIYTTLNPGDNIQTAVTACPVGQVVKLNPGTFIVTSTITMKSGVVLRGSGSTGANKTTLTVTNIYPVIDVGSWSENNAPYVNVTSGYTNGSTSITVSDASGYLSSDYAIITQNNGSNPLQSSWCSGYARTGRQIGQIIKITSKDGNTLTLENPIHWIFESGYDPEIERLVPTGSSPSSYVGIEDLYIVNTGSTQTQGSGIRMQNAAYSWIKNVESDKISGSHFYLVRCYACVVRDSYVHHATVYTSGGVAYGINLEYQTSDCLVENNITYYLNSGLFVKNSGGGNVIAYNYAAGSWLNEIAPPDYPDPSWQMADLGTHQCYPHMELFEGNQATHICPDFIHGGAGYLTFFRNHMTGITVFPYSPPANWNGTDRNQGALQLESENYYMNSVGNVLLTASSNVGKTLCGAGTGESCPGDSSTQWYGTAFGDIATYNTAYRHGNYDYISASIQWDAGNADHTIPNSMYLDSAPPSTWWCSESTWPPVNPEGPTVSDIPAKRRFDGSVCTTDAPSAITGVSVR